MTRLYLPDSEAAYTRHVLCAAELVDPVTLELVTRQVVVTAPPLAGRPLQSRSGRFVWLRGRTTAATAWPDRMIVEPAGLPYEREEVVCVPPADPANATDAELLVRVLLRPRRDYPFPDGVTVVRGRLRDAPGGADIVAAELWLQWYDSDRNEWSDAAAPGYTRTDAGGEFAVFLRLAPTATPHADGAGRIRVRLRVHRHGLAPRSGPALQVAPGRRLNAFQTLAWNGLDP